MTLDNHDHDNLESSGNSSNNNTTDIILPTYRLKPNEKEKFYPSKVYKVVHEILSREFDEAKVDEKWIEDWVDFGDEIEDLTKDLADESRHGGDDVDKCISLDCASDHRCGYCFHDSLYSDDDVFLSGVNSTMITV